MTWIGTKYSHHIAEMVLGDGCPKVDSLESAVPSMLHPNVTIPNVPYPMGLFRGMQKDNNERSKMGIFLSHKYPREYCQKGKGFLPSRVCRIGAAPLHALPLLLSCSTITAIIDRPSVIRLSIHPSDICIDYLMIEEQAAKHQTFCPSSLSLQST